MCEPQPTGAKRGKEWRMRGTGAGWYAFVRFFACEQDVRHEASDAPPPDATATTYAQALLVLAK